MKNELFMKSEADDAYTGFAQLISCDVLARRLSGAEAAHWLVVDCRFALGQPEAKQEEYLQAHIPGAIYAYLDRDLSAAIVPGLTGRHPLPTPEEAARRFGQMGIGPGIQVVAYDDQGGALAAVRLWWMLHWLGHDAAAILDGGWQKWMKEGRPTRGGQETHPPATFTARPRPELIVTADEVESLRQDPTYRVVDVRVAERYRGEVEPIDRVAGHIPGAVNAPYTANTAPDWTFRSPTELQAYYQALLGDISPERSVFYCGSGVTSLHSILAMELAGLTGARLYAGSWSEWIASGERPMASGE